MKTQEEHLVWTKYMYPTNNEMGQSVTYSTQYFWVTARGIMSVHSLTVSHFTLWKQQLLRIGDCDEVVINLFPCLQLSTIFKK